MSTNVSVRRPAREELLDLRAFRRREMLGEQNPPPGLAIDPIDLAESVILLAAYLPDGSLVSTVRMNPIAEDKTVYEVSRMVTSKAHRREGIGNELLAAAEDAAMSRGAKGFVLNSRADAQDFYAKAGYWKTGRTVTHESGDINYVMVKEVRPK